MKTRRQKIEDLEKISGAMDGCQFAVCVDYHGLSVPQINELRQQLTDAGAEATVIKNTLARLAASQVMGDSPAEDLEKFVNLFEGPSMLIIGKEAAVEPAKVIAKFAKENESLGVKGGWFSNSFLDEKGVAAVSKMPSREEVLGQLLNLLNAPATELVRLLNTPAQQTVQILSSHRDNLEG